VGWLTDLVVGERVREDPYLNAVAAGSDPVTPDHPAWTLRGLASGEEGEDVSKAVRVDLAGEEEAPRSWLFDPMHIRWSYSGDVPGEVHPGTLGFTYGTLTAMSRVPVVGAVHQTRIQQVAECAEPQRSPYSLGSRIVMRDRGAKPTPAVKRAMAEVMVVVQRAGGRYQSGGFESFLRMLMRDSLAYDQGNFEPIFDRKGKPWGFIAVDASTIRRAKPSEEAIERGTWDPEKVSYVQVDPNRQSIVNEYARSEMGWGIRRPRTWLPIAGYGFPENEEIVTVVTSLLNAETFNAVNFTSGIHSSTILALMSNMTDDSFRAFRRSVTSMLSGVANSRRVPIIQLDPKLKEELKSVSLGHTNKEMEFSNWINWLMKVACAVYQIDPAELGFVFGSEGQTSALQQAGPAQRVLLSRERGLRPLLRSVASWLNEVIVWPMYEDLSLEFGGFDSMPEDQKVDLDIKRLTNYMRVNEVRAEHDEEPIPGPLGDMIMNPNYLQAAMTMGLFNPPEGGEVEGGEVEGGEEFGEGEAFGFSSGGRLQRATSYAELWEELEKGLSSAVDDRRLDLSAYRSGDKWVPVVRGPGDVLAVSV